VTRPCTPTRTRTQCGRATASAGSTALKRQTLLFSFPSFSNRPLTGSMSFFFPVLSLQHPFSLRFFQFVPCYSILGTEVLSICSLSRILVVSGDADSAVPFEGTLRWMNCLGRPVKKDWSNWMLNQDVAGSKMEWEGITFVSVKGCGHTIPSYCPEAGFAFWQNYLQDSFE